MNVYYNPTVPLFLTTEAGFDSYPVDVPEQVALALVHLADLQIEMEAAVYAAGAPEDCAQELADIVSTRLSLMLKENKDAKSRFSF